MPANYMRYTKGRFLYVNRMVYVRFLCFKIKLFPCKGYQAGVNFVNRLHYLSGAIRED